MTERLLQFIWQMQYFNKQSLLTVQGEALQIVQQGELNTNQGPDFLNGKIKLDATTWAGNIELHINSSHWLQHKHSGDKNYNNIILHVVWENDVTIHDANGEPLPTLELKERISNILLNHYEQLMNNNAFVPCDQQLTNIRSITWSSWKERLLVERLQQKMQLVQNHLLQTNNHWEESFWRMLARNFGIKINQESFEAIAASIPINVLAKHKNQIHHLEAFLLGQANLLQVAAPDDYTKMLQKEYQFLQSKYQLPQVKQAVLFLRMRPSNFPSIRLAQLAMLVHNSQHLFSKIKEATDIKNVISLLNVEANDYWHYHYKPSDDAGAFKPKHLGDDMINNIIINTVVPVLFTYAIMHKDTALRDKALKWLEQTSKETNAITKNWEAIGVSNKSAFDSQALLQLYNGYCKEKKCLQCAVGNAILKMQ
jgi:Protein of unknown function (DUF2851)